MQTYQAKALNGHIIVFVEHTMLLLFRQNTDKEQKFRKT